MELTGFDVEAQTPEPADLATDAGRWFAEHLGVVPRLTAYVDDLDAASAELTAAGTTVEPLATPPDTDELEEDAALVRAARVTLPAGFLLDLVQPVPPGRYEERITRFIDSAADLEGPATEDVADGVLAIVTAAWDAIDAHLEGVAHDKVLATQLLLSQQTRSDTPDSPGFWQRSAASTLLGGFVGRGATS